MDSRSLHDPGLPAKAESVPALLERARGRRSARESIISSSPRDEMALGEQTAEPALLLRGYVATALVRVVRIPMTGSVRIVVHEPNQINLDLRTIGLLCGVKTLIQVILVEACLCCTSGQTLELVGLSARSQRAIWPAALTHRASGRCDPVVGFVASSPFFSPHDSRDQYSSKHNRTRHDHLLSYLLVTITTPILSGHCESPNQQSAESIGLHTA